MKFLPERIKLHFASSKEDKAPIDSGFGPFSLTRIAYETGGIYFAVHPNRNVNRAVSRADTDKYSAHIKHFFDPQIMRRYRPEYVSAKEYRRRIKASTMLSNNQEATAMLQRVGRRISAVAKLPNAQWEFVLFEKSQANAFCLPGGKVGVNTGMLAITQDEAGLATVLAHEVAHAAAHHSAERVSRMLAIQGIGFAVISNVNNVSAGTRNLLYAGYGIGTTVGSELPHGRAQELEADEIGLIYMAKAGYDPRRAVNFWKRMAAQARKSGGGRPPEFLSTHPSGATRISQIQRWMPEALRYYKP